MSHGLVFPTSLIYLVSHRDVFALTVVVTDDVRPLSADVTTILEEIPGLVPNSSRHMAIVFLEWPLWSPSTRFDLLNGPEPHVDIVDVEDDMHDEMRYIRAFYNHSIRTYTHLPVDICICRPCTSSRPTPHKSRTPKGTAG